MIPLDHFSEEPGCRAGLSKKARNKHEELNRKLYISKDGYMEAFLVNETSENVWFDQFRIETTTPVILQETHYDPWGVELQGLGYQEPGSKVNKYLYNGKEFNDHQGLNLFDYGARLYDASVGRWFVVDPLAELPSQIAHSPYVYAWNNPVGMIDPTGMAAEDSDPGKKGKKEDPPPGWNDGPVMEGVDVTAKGQYGPPDFRSMHWDNHKAQTGWVDEKKISQQSKAGSSNQNNQRVFGDPISFLEARNHYLKGKGSSLHVFLKNIDLSKIRASDFEEGVGQTKSFNLANKYYSSFNDALVYGSIELKLINPNTVVVSRQESYGLPMDVYDFDLKPWNAKTLIRNVETIGGWVVNGGNIGRPYIIWIYGEAKISEY